LKALVAHLRGPKTEGPMAREIDLTKARRSERLHEKHVYDAMKDVPLTGRDKRWFEAKNLPLPGNEPKTPSVAAE
jgi:hypothetical protein